jgi:PiT family inorganic phosphate transporter
MELFGQTVSAGSAIFLLLALGLALSFEFVNGFHDTANAVATVIYTHTLRPNVAVVWSGMWNLIGVLTSAGGVAFGVVALLPVELVLNVTSGAGFAMVFALLMAAMIWNVGTWYFGLPASSSHALIGSITGVGLANSLFASGRVFGEGVDWGKASEVGMALLFSPLIGFAGAALLLLLMMCAIRRKDLYRAPDKERTPPLWIRGVLVLTCTGVSFGHGSNDGQKGMGLIMLILIGILPASFAVNLEANQNSIQELSASAQTVAAAASRHAPGVLIDDSEMAMQELSAFLKTTGSFSPRTFAAVAAKSREISRMLQGRATLRTLSAHERRLLRTDLYLTSEALGKLAAQNKFADPEERRKVEAYRQQEDRLTKFIPAWIKVAVALALGLGTMIGWKRIVVTVGEKIGKQHLTYAQGAAAELVAAGTIMAADQFRLPVSTTHVLSSGIAGTMAANQSGVQTRTLRNLILAWVLTLPVTVLLGATIFAFSFNVLLRLGIR